MGKSVNLGIIVSAVNKFSPVLSLANRQVEQLQKSTKKGGGESGGAGGLGLDLGKLGGNAMASAARLGSAALTGVSIAFQVVGKAASIAGGIAMRVLQGIWSAAQSAAGMIANLGRGFLNLSKWAALAAAVGIGAIAKSSLDASMKVEGFLAKLTTALKSTAAAKSMLAWATNFAAITPFSQEEVVDSTVRLELYGISAKKWLTLVGDMAGAMGKRVTDAVEAIADAFSGGGLERLKEFGINSMKLISSGWTGTYQTVAGITSLKTALENIIKRDFGGGMNKLAKTSIGALSNFQDSIFAIKVQIGQALTPSLQAAIAWASGLLTQFQKLGYIDKLGKGLAGTFNWILAALKGLSGNKAVTQLGTDLQLLGTNIAKAFGLDKLSKTDPVAWITGVVEGIDKAVQWLNNTVFSPEALKGITDWVSGMYDSVTKFLGNTADFIQNNFQSMGKWFEYFVDYGKYLVGWCYQHFPDLVDIFSSVFGGASRFVLGLGIAFVSAWSGIQGFADMIATVFVGVVEGANRVMGTFLDILLAVAKATNFNGSNDYTIKLIESAKATMPDFRGTMAEQWDKTKENLQRNQDRMNEMRKLMGEVGGAEAKGHSTADYMRQHQGNFGENATPPVAPKNAPFVPFGTPAQGGGAGGDRFIPPDAGQQASPDKRPTPAEGTVMPTPGIAPPSGGGWVKAGYSSELTLNINLKSDGKLSPEAERAVVRTVDTAIKKMGLVPT